jgi:hypothetical protein
VNKRIIFAGLLVISSLSLAACFTAKNYLRWGNEHMEKQEYDDAIEWFTWGVEDYPKSEELKAALKQAKAMKEQHEQHEKNENEKKKYDDEEDFEVRSNDGNSVEISSYKGKKDTIIIPSQIQGKPVTKIGDSAFKINNIFDRKIYGVTIPDSVITIGDRAFEGNSLTSVTIPNSVTIIGDSAFYKNRLTSVIIPNNVTSIEIGVFMDNQLTSVIIPNGITSIGASAFRQNKLTSVTIPNSVSSIGNNAFLDNQLTSVTIPNSVTIIGGAAFSRNQLKSVVISNNVSFIEVNTFANNHLSSVTIPDSVTSIKVGAFFQNNLSSVTIPNSIKIIEGGAFRQNQLTDVAIPANVTSIGDLAFADNKLTNVTIQNHMTSISDSAFSNNGLFEFDLWSGLYAGMNKDQLLIKARKILKVERPVEESSGFWFNSFGYDNNLTNRFPQNLSQVRLISTLPNLNQVVLGNRAMSNINLCFSGNNLFAMFIHWDFPSSGIGNTSIHLISRISSQYGEPQVLTYERNGFRETYYRWETQEKIIYAQGLAMQVINKQLLK